MVFVRMREHCAGEAPDVPLLLDIILLRNEFLQIGDGIYRRVTGVVGEGTVPAVSTASQSSKSASACRPAQA